MGAIDQMMMAYRKTSHMQHNLAPISNNYMCVDSSLSAHLLKIFLIVIIKKSGYLLFFVLAL